MFDAMKPETRTPPRPQARTKRARCESETMRHADAHERLLLARPDRRETGPGRRREAVVLHVARARIEGRALRDAVIRADLHAPGVVVHAAHEALKTGDFDGVRGRRLDRRAEFRDAERMRSIQA